MFAIPTLRRHHRHGNLSIRWRPDRQWLLLVLTIMFLGGAAGAVLVLSLWYTP